MPKLPYKAANALAAINVHTREEARQALKDGRLHLVPRFLPNVGPVLIQAIKDWLGEPDTQEVTVRLEVRATSQAEAACMLQAILERELLADSSPLLAFTIEN